MPGPKRLPIRLGSDNRRLIGTLAVYEQVQVAHSRQETVRVRAGGDGAGRADADFRNAAAGSLRADRRGVRQRRAIRRTFSSSGAARAFGAGARRRRASGAGTARRRICRRLRSHFESAGLVAAAPRSGVLSSQGRREESPETRRQIGQCPRHAPGGGDQRRLRGGPAALRENPRSIEAHLVMAELSLETENGALAAKMLARARALDPAEPRIELLEMSVAGRGRPVASARAFHGGGVGHFRRAGLLQTVIRAARTGGGSGACGGPPRLRASPSPAGRGGTPGPDASWEQDSTRFGRPPNWPGAARLPPRPCCGPSAIRSFQRGRGRLTAHRGAGRRQHPRLAGPRRDLPRGRPGGPGGGRLCPGP